MKPDRPPGPSHPVTAATAGPEAEADRRLVTRAQGGEEEAFRMLVERHKDRVYATALRITGSPRDAEEVAQDAFVRAWRSLSGFRGDSSFSTWIYRIVFRLGLDRRRVVLERRGRESPADESVLTIAGGPATEPEVEGTGVVAHLLEVLNDVQRAAVRLYYLEDRPVAEVAELLGLPANTVKTHLSRARGAMRAAHARHEARCP